MSEVLAVFLVGPVAERVCARVNVSHTPMETDILEISFHRVPGARRHAWGSSPSASDPELPLLGQDLPGPAVKLNNF